VGCNLYERQIPIDPSVYKCAKNLILTATTVAINGGEDYDCFTIAMEDFEKIKGNPTLRLLVT
jgi:thiamine-monophosphate kinase